MGGPAFDFRGKVVLVTGVGRADKFKADRDSNLRPDQ